ncbi:MAG: hypothetical protein K8R77_14070 [Anaerolineaceae bacterium]|nr:hypothetical protein [Anaerolineaceae bacterium]
MENLLDRSSFILVVFVPQPRDLEIVRLLGWYRIPMRSAPKVIEVDYLAFYQPASFGKGHRWQIEQFAELRGYELVRRMDLFRDEMDHPRAQEEYFKMQVGAMQTLSRPILAEKFRRLTFLYTTGALFRKAQTVSDLVVSADERAGLWRALRERVSLANQYHTNDDLDFELTPELLLLLGDFGKISDQETPYEAPGW